MLCGWAHCSQPAFKNVQAAIVAAAKHLTADQIEGLRQLFQSFDKNGTSRGADSGNASPTTSLHLFKEHCAVRGGVYAC